MVVISIVITTIVVFVIVDLLLRLMLTRARDARARKERERVLETSLRMDVSDESPSLKRVELENPKARILAVDDEAIILDSFRKILVLGGYSIDTVETGAEALGLIRGRNYDFLFTDLKMPGMNGVELTRTARHLRPDIDVVVITGFATIESAVETVKSGALDYLEKPFTEDELLAFVDAALIRRREALAQQARHTLRLVRPGTGESRSPFELNVPAGAFVSPQHSWVSIGLNGLVRVGLDDMVRKLFGEVKNVVLPEPGAKVEKGAPLFTVDYGEFQLEFAAPLSGRVVSVNSEHAEHPEWLPAKPFELSWMCGIEPSDLAAELPALMVGQDALDWYRQELDRFNELVDRPTSAAKQKEAGDRTAPESRRSDRLVEFSKPFRVDLAA